MYEEVLKEHLYSKNDEVVRIANQALGMALGVKFAKDKARDANVSIRTTVDAMAQRFLIDAECVLSHAQKHYDYLTAPARSVTRVFSISAMMGWDQYYTQHDLDELEENIGVVDACFAYVAIGMGF